MASPTPNKDKKVLKPEGLHFAPAERPLIEALKLINDGDDLCAASDDMKELIQAVRQHGGKGSLTLTLKVEGKGKNLKVALVTTIKKPRGETFAAMVFADDRGHLVPFDPDQYRFDDVLDEAKEANAA